MKKIIILCITLMSIMMQNVYAVDLHSESLIILPASYEPSNKLTGNDGTEYIINGGFNFSFYSDSDVNAEITISMAGFAGEKYGLFFLNETDDTDIVYHNQAPEMASALGGGAISLKESGITDAEAVKADDFSDYTFKAKVKQGVNTVYVPPYDLTNDCGNFIYVQSGVKCNRQVCIKSVTVEKSLTDKIVINVSELDNKYLTYHSDGYIYPGKDAEDERAVRTVFQSHECMYTAVPFEIDTAGDYIVNVRYNTFTSNNMNSQPRAAVYLDGSLDALGSKDWLPFLGGGLSEEEKVQIVSQKLASVTYDGKIEAIDIGTWKSCFSIEGDSKTWPYYNLKSFKLDNLEPGEHNLLFYTGRGILEDESSTIVNKGVMFNSFEIKRVYEKNESVDTFAVPLRTTSNWTAYKFTADIAEYVSEDETVFYPVTIANNKDTPLGAMLVFAYYDSENVLINVKITHIELAAYESYEQMLKISKPDNEKISYVKTMLIDEQNAKPYFEKADKVIFVSSDS